jgi:F420-dependent oxidoreductase-like protein
MAIELNRGGLMRFGIKTNPQHTNYDALLATWKRADEIGVIESAWVFDHFYPIFSDSTGPCMEAWTTLTALAVQTNRLLVGSMVNGMPYRHPAITANMAATVDIVSNGRLQLGLGAGWNKEESDAYGINLGDNLTERFDMFDESVEIVVSLLENEWTTFEGKHFVIRNARNEPKGPQQPHPPIVIGGGGEKRTLRTVARFADHWNAGQADAATFLHKRAVLERHCAYVGRDPSEIMSSVMKGFDPSEDVAEVRAFIEQMGEAGVEKIIATMPTPHEPGHVDQWSEIVSPYT